MHRFFWLALNCAILSGCSVFLGAPYESRLPSNAAKMPAASDPADAGGDPAELHEEVMSEPITLGRAIQLSLNKNPGLAAAHTEIGAREAEALQAGLLPNPELEAELEDIYGGVNGPAMEEQDLSDLNGAEGTVVLSQLIELGGKRKKRRSVAEKQADIAVWEFETQRYELIGEVHRVFVELLAAQERASLARELYEVASRADATAAARVDAGKVSPLEKFRTTVSLSVAAGQRDRAEIEVAGLRHQLAAFWGESHPRFDTVAGDLNVLQVVPSYSSLVERLSSTPEFARWEDEVLERRAVFALARAEGIPDPTVSAGARYFNETDNHSFLVGLSIPIPLFDRNQGNVEAARLRIVAAEHQREAVAMQLHQRLSFAHRRLNSADRIVRRLTADALPHARKAFEIMLEGYQLGEFDLTSLLDAQHSLFEVRTQHLDALIDYHTALAELETLLGGPLSNTQGESTNTEGAR